MKEWLMFHTPCTAGGDMQLHNVCTCSNEEEEEEEHLAKGPKQGNLFSGICSFFDSYDGNQ